MIGRKNIRLKKYDYSSSGYYFVTIVTRLRHNLLSGKENRIEQIWKDIENKNPGVSLDYYVVMPNHVHAIIILEDSRMHLGEVVRRFKAKVTYEFEQNIWQANYYEHVIRDEVALQKIREYIVNNPQAAEIDFKLFYK